MPSLKFPHRFFCLLSLIVGIVEVGAFGVRAQGQLTSPPSSSPSSLSKFQEELRKAAILQSEGRFKETYSLLKALSQPSGQTEKAVLDGAFADLHIAWGQSLIGDDEKKAISHFEDALHFSRALKDQKRQLLAMRRLGETQLQNYSNIRKAVPTFRQVLLIARALKDEQAEAEMLELLGDAYAKLDWQVNAYTGSQNGACKSAYQQAVTVYERLNQPTRAAVVLMKLSTSVLEPSSWADLELGLSSLQRALDLYRSAKDLRGEATVFNALAEVSRGAQQLGYYQKALALFREVSDAKGQINTLALITGFYRDEEPEKALIYAHQRSHIALQTKDSEEIMFARYDVDTLNEDIARRISERAEVLRSISKNVGKPNSIGELVNIPHTVVVKAQRSVVGVVEGERKTKGLVSVSSKQLQTLKPVSLPIATDAGIGNLFDYADEVGFGGTGSLVWALWKNDLCKLYYTTDYSNVFDGSNHLKDYTSQFCWLRRATAGEQRGIRKRLQRLEQPLVYAPFSHKIYDPKRYPKIDRIIVAHWGKYVQRVEFNSANPASKYFKDAPFVYLAPQLKRAWIEFCVRIDEKGRPIRLPSAFGRVIAVETNSELLLAEQLDVQAPLSVGGGNPKLIDLGDK